MDQRSSETPTVDWLATQKEAMLALLAEIVNIDSGSYDKAGVDRVGAVIQQFLAGHGIAVEVLPQHQHGDCLRARIDPDAPTDDRPILLMGHRDTVYPAGETARRPFTLQNGQAYGPGVADMKAGLVMNCFVLAAFRRFGGHAAPVIGLFTADEEIGSPEGRAVIEAEARGARAVFNSEPGRVSGNIVTGRKGGVFSAFRITGKAAHAGASFTQGISAIEELARKVQALHALTDLDRGITVNVGLVSGGQSVNTVAPWAEGQIDLRYIEQHHRDGAMAAMAAVIAQSHVAGTSAELTIRGEFLPLEPSAASERLFALYQQAARDSGFAPGGEFTGGCADSGFTAALGVPTLCAVGPVGGRAHSPDEFLCVDTMVPRAQACARTVLRLHDSRV